MPASASRPWTVCTVPIRWRAQNHGSSFTKPESTPLLHTSCRKRSWTTTHGVIRERSGLPGPRCWATERSHSSTASPFAGHHLSAPRPSMWIHPDGPRTSQMNGGVGCLAPTI
jgi:hypothetical protein